MLGRPVRVARERTRLCQAVTPEEILRFSPRFQGLLRRMNFPETASS